MSTKKPAYRKAENLIQKFQDLRYARKTTVREHIDMLAVGKSKGLKGKEGTYFIGRVFSAILMDIHFHNITDAVVSPDETASIRVFKKAMRKALKLNGTPSEHHLYRQ